MQKKIKSEKDKVECAKEKFDGTKKEVYKLIEPISSGLPEDACRTEETTQILHEKLKTCEEIDNEINELSNEIDADLRSFEQDKDKRFSFIKKWYFVIVLISILGVTILRIIIGLFYQPPFSF